MKNPHPRRRLLNTPTGCRKGIPSLLLLVVPVMLVGAPRAAHAGPGSGGAGSGGPSPVLEASRATPGTLGPRRAPADTVGQRLYELGCASCHGADGRGAPQERVAFEASLPDFTDCSFASREPNADWAAIVHAGGPVRAFDSTMPAFGEAFSEEEIASVLRYVRSFCDDPSWPRGELNVPRAFFTEKAYPEDEFVATADIAAEGPAGASTALLYEKRFGARNQIEVEVPLAYHGAGDGLDSNAGVGDIAVAFKRALWHSLERGGILSTGAEVVLPTGDRDRGFGTGTVVFEPFVAFAKLFPSDAFFQFQGLVEVPADPDRAESEAGARAVLGRTFAAGEFGRTWTPMIEVLGSRELDAGVATSWDLVPQIQVSLNTRQHVLANIGLRVPVTDADARSTQFLVYILWDWFDGGFFDGW